MYHVKKNICSYLFLYFFISLPYCGDDSKNYLDRQTEKNLQQTCSSVGEYLSFAREKEIYEALSSEL